jgi:nucleoside-diphosphate-sugar epimerase
LSTSSRARAPVLEDDAAGLVGESVLVTGAGGFIGSTVVGALLQRGAKVRALAGAPGQDTSELPAGLTAVHADIGDHAVLLELAAGASIAIHLAGPPSVGASFEAPLEYGRVHAGGTLGMLEACRFAGVRRLIYLSSAEVYGRPSVERVAEDHPLGPRSPYAASKAAAEQYVGAYGRGFGLETVILRPFSVYGPGLAAGSVLGTIMHQALRGDEVVLADLAPVRDYVFVSDVVLGILRAAVASCSGETFNLGSGVGTSVAGLARKVLILTGRMLPVRSDPARRRASEAEIHHLVADPTRAERVLGWIPVVPLEEGLRQTLRWMENG